MQELGRALHMAFFVWQPDAILTSPCDNDIQSLCLVDRPNMAKTPGAVGACLTEIVGVVHLHVLPGSTASELKKAAQHLS